MKRYSPTLDIFVETPFATMEEDSSGIYVTIEDVYNWIRNQRNEIPVTGEELANGFLYSLGESNNQF